MFKIARPKSDQTMRVSPASIIAANEEMQRLEFERDWERARADTAEAIVRCLSAK